MARNISRMTTLRLREGEADRRAEHGRGARRAEDGREDALEK